MVTGYYNEINAFNEFQSYINVNNRYKKAIKTFKVKYSYRSLVGALIWKNKAIPLKNKNFRTITLKYIYAMKKQYLK